MADITGMLQAAAGVGGGGGNAWDISLATVDVPSAYAWDLSKAGGRNIAFSISAQEATPRDLFFKPDGTKMYVMGDGTNDVLEYNLSIAWDITTASFVQGFDVAGQDGTPRAVYFKPDGTKMYVVGATNDRVYEYNLSTAWDVSSASYVQFFSVAAKETVPEGLSFKTDGTKMYVAGPSSDSVHEYDLSSAWDISTASFLQSFSVSAAGVNPEGLFFRDDGEKLYVVGGAGNNIYEYDLSTPWDISTLSSVQNINTGLDTKGVFFKPDGLLFYIVDATTDAVYAYAISGGFSVATEELTPESVFFKDDGTKMYVLGSSGDDVNEYDLSTAWDILSASYLQAFSIAGQETAPSGLFFGNSGSNMYVIGRAGDDINEYSLSSAWDVSSASFVRTFSVAAKDTNPSGLFFKSDGTKMYVAGYTSDSVHEYDLSTAWNISTASFLQSFSVSSQDSEPHNIFFKPDGTKMYVIGFTNKRLYEYDLSSAWDVSTASYLQNFPVGYQDSQPSGIFFQDDGTAFYMVGIGTDTVFKYLIS